MIILITGASHTGKTLLAQKLLEKYNYPYLSIDHLKMGMIRSGNTQLTPVSDDTELTMFLWPIVREIIKTVIENRQNLIIEGCYIPFDWKKDFTDEYRKDIRGYCLAMSENYIRMHFDDIKQFAYRLNSATTPKVESVQFIGHEMLYTDVNQKNREGNQYGSSGGDYICRLSGTVQDRGAVPGLFIPAAVSERV